MSLAVGRVGGLTEIISYIQRGSNIRSESSVDSERPGTQSTKSPPSIVYGTKLMTAYGISMEESISKAVLQMGDSIRTARELALGNIEGYAIAGKVVATGKTWGFG